ncbi:MAG TPA: hypothetical protein VNJ02_00295 [Vicinamibacterales bacterium]|nr:hypothetical protein [Vicinamibacterales bacterium]
MKLTITYKPHTVTVPNWAAEDVKNLLKRTRSTKPKTAAIAREELNELLGDIAENEGWFPEFDFSGVKS